MKRLQTRRHLQEASAPALRPWSSAGDVVVLKVVEDGWAYPGASIISILWSHIPNMAVVS